MMNIRVTVLDLPKHKIILGRSWLKALNPRMDWRRERMVIRVNRKSLVFVPLLSNMLSQLNSSQSYVPMNDQDILMSTMNDDTSGSHGASFLQSSSLRQGNDHKDDDIITSHGVSFLCYEPL